MRNSVTFYRENAAKNTVPGLATLDRRIPRCTHNRPLASGDRFATRAQLKTRAVCLDYAVIAHQSAARGAEIDQAETD